MKDVLDRDVVVGNGVLYSSTKGHVIATVTDINNKKVTIEDANGKTSTVSTNPKNFYLIS